MLSDFGTAQDMLSSSHIRSGNTGTLEYCAPESVTRDPSGELRPIDSRSDMWSLGMILHKMVFFNLPFSNVTATDFERLEREISCYAGYDMLVLSSRKT
jgi:serine/threonine protein kinase